MPIAIPPADPLRLAAAEALAASAPEPAQCGSVRCGTAGWTDPTLLAAGVFYPRGMKTPEARLRYYASRFPLVEVDATYYALLSPDIARRWLCWTPESFRFDVKAFPILTGHPIEVARLPADLKAACRELAYDKRVYPERLPSELAREMRARFFDFVAPLARAGRLGAVFLQFPPWFTATRENLAALSGLRAEQPELPFAVEFRHPSWLSATHRAQTLALLRAEALSYVCVDAPNASLAALEVTHSALAVVRFHGRNAREFQRRGASVHQRFDYLYVPEELRPWVEPMRRLAGQASEVHAVFNNCVRNYAVLNALDLAALLVERGGAAAG